RYLTNSTNITNFNAISSGTWGLTNRIAHNAFDVEVESAQVCGTRMVAHVKAGPRVVFTKLVITSAILKTSTITDNVDVTIYYVISRVRFEFYTDRVGIVRPLYAELRTDVFY